MLLLVNPVRYSLAGRGNFFIASVFVDLRTQKIKLQYLNHFNSALGLL